MIEAQRGTEKEPNPDPLSLKAKTPDGSFEQVGSPVSNTTVER